MDMLHLLKNVWDNITPSSIIKCWLKADTLCERQTNELQKMVTPCKWQNDFIVPKKKKEKKKAIVDFDEQPERRLYQCTRETLKNLKLPNAEDY